MKKLLLLLLLGATVKTHTENLVIDGHTIKTIGTFTTNDTDQWNHADCSRCTLDTKPIGGLLTCSCWTNKGKYEKTGIYPALETVTPDGKKFTPVIKKTSDGTLTLDNTPSGSTLLETGYNSTKYLVYGSFNQSMKSCVLEPFTDYAGGNVSNGTIICEGKYSAFPALTAESPYGGMHTPIFTNRNMKLVDTHKNGSYLSLLNKFFGGNWENRAGGCYYSIYQSKRFFTQCDTGHCHRTISKGGAVTATIFSGGIYGLAHLKGTKCNNMNIITVDSTFKRLREIYNIANGSGYLTWKTKVGNDWATRIGSKINVRSIDNIKKLYPGSWSKSCHSCKIVDDELSCICANGKPKGNKTTVNFPVGTTLINENGNLIPTVSNKIKKLFHGSWSEHCYACDYHDDTLSCTCLNGQGKGNKTTVKVPHGTTLWNDNGNLMATVSNKIKRLFPGSWSEHCYACDYHDDTLSCTCFNEQGRGRKTTVKTPPRTTLINDDGRLFVRVSNKKKIEELFPGSWSKSCHSCKLFRDELTCICANGKPKGNKTTVKVPHGTTLINDNGNLITTVSNKIKRLFPGSWSEHCYACNYHDDRLRCVCRDDHGEGRRTTLRTPPGTTLVNDSGRLFATASNKKKIEELFPGSWSKSCHSCKFFKDELSCTCLDRQGKSKKTTVKASPGTTLVNDNGKLKKE